VDFLHHLETIPDKSNVDLRWPIQVMVSNVINDVLFGFRFPYDDCQPLMDYVLRFNEMMNNVMENKWLALGMALPFLRHVPYLNWYIVGRARQKMIELNQYIVDNVERALKDYNVEDEPTCFAHAYKQRMQDNKGLDDVNLMSTCADFFLAGQETTTTTLRWAMLLLAKHSEIQEKLRREIRSAIGTERTITRADQASLPFARACVLELQRFANIVGTNVQRLSTRDTEIRGHKIPKNTWVNGDIHYLMANDPVFVDPQEFRPERYIAEDGKSLRKDLIERTLPFSIGKRMCAGEGLARVELFLGLTSTFQQFKILPSPGNEIDLEP
ncbi:hypothetical protein PENTCL1PPCAC_14989, partial [Pristionchus entomophagus]